MLYDDKLDYYVEEVLLRDVAHLSIRVPSQSGYAVVGTTEKGQRDGRVGRYCGWIANDQCSQGEIHAHMMVSSEAYLLFGIPLNRLNICHKQQTHKDCSLETRPNRELTEKNSDIFRYYREE